MATTAGLVAFLAGTPMLIALVVRRVLSGPMAAGAGGVDALDAADSSALVLAFVACCAWLPGAMAVVAELRQRDRPVRPVRLVPASIRRAVARRVEDSLLGAGTLRGWTTTRVGASLADLEVPSLRDETAGEMAGEEAIGTAGSDPSRERRRWSVRERVARGARRVRPPSSGPHRRDAIPEMVRSRTVAPMVPAARPSAVTEAFRVTRPYVVAQGDTWWGLAERFLDDGRRFCELKDLNAGRSQADGTVVAHNVVLRAGWTIEVPAGRVRDEGALAQ